MPVADQIYHMGLLLLFAFLSIAFSFLCSVWEAVLLSIPPSYAHIKQEEGSTTGRLLAEFKKDIDRPLSAILSLNTIAHTAGAIGVGAVAADAFGSGNIVLFGLALPFSPEAFMGFVMTLAILVLSEIIPKTIGATYWQKMAPFTVRSLNIITTLLLPLVWMSQFITRKLKKGTEGSIFSRADFTAMAEIGAQHGVFQEEESRIIRNLMRFENITIEDIMTPRTVVMAVRENYTINAFYEKQKDLPFSRVPVYRENRDQITGFVLKVDALKHIIEGKGDQQLKSIRRDILMVREDMPLPEFFNMLIEEQEQIAVAVDKFGGLAGIVSMEDAMETLLGLEIVDEVDDAVDMQSLARTNWRNRAVRMGIDLDRIERHAESEEAAASGDGSSPARTPRQEEPQPAAAEAEGKRPKRGAIKVDDDRIEGEEEALPSRRLIIDDLAGEPPVDPAKNSEE